MNVLGARWIAETPHAPALRLAGRTWTWAQVDEDARAWCRRFAQLGLAAGDRVGILAQNAPETVFAVHAAARSGITLALLNTRLTRKEWADQLRRTRCKRAFVGPELADVELGIPSEPLRCDVGAGAEVAAAPDPARPLVLLFTSGTTGKPKAAALSLGALIAHAEASAQHLGSAATDVHLCNLPLFHVGGLSMIFRTAQCGGTLVVHPRFDAELLLRDLEAERVTHLSLVATTLQRTLEALGGRPLVAPALVRVLLGGGPLPAPLREAALALGLPLLATYGLTEACSQVTTVPPHARGRAGASSGLPLPGVEVRIVDEQRRPLPPGSSGEIEVRSPGLMLGYDGDPAATAAALEGGWLRTRDLGTLDPEGWLTVHARRTDLILSGGENVYPAEIEAALLGIPGVRDAAVIGRADPKWGQVPVAALVLAPGAEVEAVRTQLEDRLARFKLPRELYTLPDLPRTASGKLIRDQLRARLGLAHDS